ncbi:predicted protein [Chaetoceros tenuissimus]|uniref:Uncharacterized protein n=1 Tax=Chaetoceros tenuissimus TaxID=426638 RepID=A0AAD3HG44_9STRA|nr:predicted protein [Chaetoceros tenuissimus]
MIAKITESLVAADPLKVLFGLYSFIASVNFISYITILVQMFLNTQVNNEGQRQWNGPGAEENSSVLFTVVALMACLTYFSVVIYKIYKNENETSSSSMIGRMTGSYAAYATLCMMACLHIINFSREEREENNQDNENNEMPEGYIQYLVSAISFAFALSFMFLAMGTVFAQKKYVAYTAGGQKAEVDATSASTAVDIFKSLFKFLSVYSIVGIALPLILCIVSSFTEEGQRMREEGSIWNMLLSSLFLLSVAIGVYIVGTKIMNGNSNVCETKFGAFTAFLSFFGITCLVGATIISGFYIPIGEEWDMNRQMMEDGPMGSMFLSIALFTMGLGYLAFAYLFKTYEEHVATVFVKKDASIATDDSYTAISA